MSSAAERDVPTSTTLEPVSDVATSSTATAAETSSAFVPASKETEVVGNEFASTSAPSDNTSSTSTTSPSLPQSDRPLHATSHADEASKTPPLPDGKTRPHPLLDDLKADEEDLDSKTQKSGEDAKRKSAMNALVQEASTQYPSPSSGFVPPVTEEDFKFGEVPKTAKLRLSKGVGLDKSNVSFRIGPGCCIDSVPLMINLPITYPANCREPGNNKRASWHRQSTRLDRSCFEQRTDGVRRQIDGTRVGRRECRNDVIISPSHVNILKSFTSNLSKQ
jgi:hypothetical protein